MRPSHVHVQQFYSQPPDSQLSQPGSELVMETWRNHRREGREGAATEIPTGESEHLGPSVLHQEEVSLLLL